MPKKVKKGKINLYYLFDKEADVLYLSQGKPSPRDNVAETSDDVLLRTDSRTGLVRGLTILNFTKHNSSKNTPVRLPVAANWVAV